MTRIWDAPTRLFHWLLAAAVGYCLYSGFFASDDLTWHMRAGQAVLGLLVFRLCWGVLGATYARFGQFLRGPGAFWAYLRGFRRQPPAAGHNPAGGWAVLAMLALLLLQAGTGLFSTDEIFNEGPLIHRVSSDTASALSGLHTRNAWLVAGLVALHLLAIAAHAWLRREPLTRAMLTGRAPIEAPATRWHPAALVVALGAGAACTYLVAEVL